MRKLLLSLLFLAPTAHAELFLDLGVGMAIGGTSCLFERIEWTSKTTVTRQCSDNPLGRAAIGYTHKNVTLSMEHTSSLTEWDDLGFNGVFLTYRFTVPKKWLGGSDARTPVE